MRIAFLVIMCVGLFALSARAGTPYTFLLNNSDSTEFIDLLKGFSGPKRVVDPEYPELLHVKYWYVTPDQAIAISCTRTEHGKKVRKVVCNFEFQVDISVENTGVNTMNEVSLHAVIEDPEAATRFYKNLKMNTFTSNETVFVEMPSGLGEVPRFRFECEPMGVLMDSASQCTIDVIFEDK